MKLRPGQYLLALAGAVLLPPLIIVTAGLQRQVADAAADVVGYGGAHSDEATGSRDLFHSGVPIGGLKHGETYGAYDRRRDNAATDNYFNFGCIRDCRLHGAGYRWAVRERVVNPRACAGSTWEFTEGCAAYVLKKE